MVSISTYTALWVHMKAVLGGIDRVMVAHEESDLASVIREFADGEMVLLAIIPSSDISSSDLDNVEEADSCYVFLVSKQDRGSITQDEYLAILEGSQGKMRELKQKLLDLAADTDHCHDTASFSHLMHKLILNSMHTDPEYNLLGCYGWALSFKLKTEGI